MDKGKKWVVTTDGKHPLSDVTKHLEKAGFTVENVLNEIGCVTGSASDQVAENLRALPGVADVSPEPPTIDIGPPDASITW